MVSFNSAFNKGMGFSYQSEVRVLLETSVEDHMILDIGPIHDIASFMSIDAIESGLRMECIAGELVELD